MKILWAVDAFEDLTELHSKSIAYLQNLAARAPLEIEPLYLLSPDQLGLPIDFSPPWRDQYEPAARKALAKKLEGLTLPGLKAPQVLIHQRASLKSSVALLSEYAATNGFQLILTGSHGRNGLDRMLLGSFSEELLLQSKIPVLVMGSAAQSLEQPESHILFPTDFSESCSTVFGKVIEFARETQSRITLLHCIPRPLEPVLQSGVYLVSGGWIPFPAYVIRESAKQAEIASQWKARAEKQGVSIKAVIDSDSSSIVESILNHARSEDTSLIAMSAASGRFASSILGSVTRKIVRTAPVPTWVLRVKT